MKTDTRYTGRDPKIQDEEEEQKPPQVTPQTGRIPLPDGSTSQSAALAEHLANRPAAESAVGASAAAA